MGEDVSATAFLADFPHFPSVYIREVGEIIKTIINNKLHYNQKMKWGKGGTTIKWGRSGGNACWFFRSEIRPYSSYKEHAEYLS